MNKRIILAHAGQQSSFRRAVALSKKGYLDKYVTTVYLKKKHLWIADIIGKLIPGEGKRLRGRNCPDLKDDDVVQFHVFRNLILVLINRFSRLNKLYEKCNRAFSIRFAKKTAKLAIFRDIDALIMMGNAPGTAFEYLKENNSKIIKIFDMTSVAYNYQFEAMIKECSKLPESWKKYVRMTQDTNDIERLMNNIFKADYLIVSSQFAKQTILRLGISSDIVKVVNYGIDAPANNNSSILNKSGKIRFLYVGSVSLDKGIHYLLEAFSKIPKDKAQLTLLGANYLPSELTMQYQDQFDFVNDVPFDEVPDYYLNADVFITPTLFDSFGKVITEALSYGLPVICTTSAGAADYIEDGINGFVIPPCSSEAIIDKVDYFLMNINMIEIMSKNAKSTITKHSWDDYDRQYTNVIEDILNTEHSI